MQTPDLLTMMRALVACPSVSSVNPGWDQSNAQVIDLLAELNQKWGRTVIIATHSTLADRYATTKIMLQDGMILDQTCGE